MRAGYENMLQRAVDAGARGPTSRLLHRRSVPANHRFPSPALVLVDSVQIRVCRNPPDGPVSGHPFCSSKTCPLEHVPGSLVPGIRRCPDSAKAEFLESEPHHLPQRFGRIAAALEVGVETESDAARFTCFVAGGPGREGACGAPAPDSSRAVTGRFPIRSQIAEPVERLEGPASDLDSGELRPSPLAFPDPGHRLRRPVTVCPEPLVQRDESIAVVAVVEAVMQLKTPLAQLQTMFSRTWLRPRNLRSFVPSARASYFLSRRIGKITRRSALLEE